MDRKIRCINIADVSLLSFVVLAPRDRSRLLGEYRLVSIRVPRGVIDVRIFLNLDL